MKEIGFWIIVAVYIIILVLMSAYAHAADTTINYKGMPVQSAISPSISAYGSDMCRSGVSGAANTGVVSISGGMTIIDDNCEKIRLARVLNDLGLKVAAVSLLCQDDRVFKSMLQAGSPCPVGGAIGDAAKKAWKELRPEVFEELYGKNTKILPTPNMFNNNKE